MRSFCPTFNTTLWFGNCEKSESLNKRALRIVFNRRIQNMLITIYKSLNYMKVFLNILKTCLLCISLYTLLRELNYNILSLCKPATTTTYGLNSFRYFASKKWNFLPNNVRSEPTLCGFKRLLKAISFLT